LIDGSHVWGKGKPKRKPDKKEADTGKQQTSPDKKVTYKTVDGVELKLHCFNPQGLKPSDQRPAIVFFFGGGWTGGTPKQFYEQARFLAGRGVVAMSAEYRIRRQHKTTPFECVKDGKSAIRWVRQHANELQRID